MCGTSRQQGHPFLHPRVNQNCHEVLPKTGRFDRTTRAPADVSVAGHNYDVKTRLALLAVYRNGWLGNENQSLLLLELLDLLEVEPLPLSLAAAFL